MRVVASLAVWALAGCNLVFGLDSPGAGSGDGAVDGPIVDAADDDGTPAIDAIDAPPSQTGITAVAAGGSHTCVIRADQVYCWGQGASGQLGYGNSVTIGDDEAPLGEPVAIGGGVPIQLALGANFSCVLLDTGAVKCWGENSRGQLGQGNTTVIGDDELPQSVPTIAIGATAMQVAAGGQHVCVALVGGKVRCWGSGSDGRLGYANQADIGDGESPFAAGDVIGVTGVFEMVAGAAHSCALYSSGAVRCWGFGGDGRLGNASTRSIGDTETPTQDADLGDASMEVVAGDAHTCARLSGGVVRCWGFGGDGRLGNQCPVNVGDDEAPRTGGAINFGANVIGLAAGSAHTCALLSTGAVRCWGKNDRGQLGRGNTLSIGDDEAPTDGQPVMLGDIAMAITAGGDHTCALLSNRTVRCWGANDAGQLGLGTIADLGDDELPTAEPAIGP